MRVRIRFALVWTLVREARSRGMNVMETEGWEALRVVMSELAEVAERPVKIIWEGLWAARRVTV